MLKHVFLILIATFIMGFVSGVVIFLYNNTGNEGDGGLKTEINTIVISARSYGGCERGGGCTSYRISDGGEYIYIAGKIDGEEMRYEDSLSKTKNDVLVESLQSVDLLGIEQTEFRGTCPIEYDDVAYRYDIEFNGEQYSFDTCVQSLEDNSFFETLETYFDVFAMTHVSNE